MNTLTISTRALLTMATLLFAPMAVAHTAAPHVHAAHTVIDLAPVALVVLATLWLVARAARAGAPDERENDT